MFIAEYQKQASINYSEFLYARWKWISYKIHGVV